MAGRGRGMDLFRKLAEMEQRRTVDEEEEQANSSLAQSETDMSQVDEAAEAARIKQVGDYNRARFGTSFADDDSTDTPSIGTETFIAPFKTYLNKLQGKAPFDDTSTIPDAASEAKPPSPPAQAAVPFQLGRGRGMFAVIPPKAVKTGSTSDSDKAKKESADPDEEIVSITGVIPKLGGRGRGNVFTSGMIKI